MLRKLFSFLVLVLAVMLTVISCNQRGSCLICPSKIKMTPTYTATPDASYSVYVHQESTPAVGVSMQLYSEDTGVTFTAVTDSKGVAGFKVNNGGKWDLSINSFNGFDSREAIVDPVGTTGIAFNYGIPSLELQLVSGSESIPISSSTLAYEIIYHTKYPRLENIVVNLPGVIYCDLPKSVGVRKEGDIIDFTLSIKNSFEDYQIISPTSSSLTFTATGHAVGITDINSNVRTLTKNWIFNVDVEFHYMAIYDYVDNGHHMSFYTGIRNIDVSRSILCQFNGALHYEATDAANEGSAGMNTPVLNTYNALLQTLGFGYFDVEAKIPTSAGWSYASSSHLDNNGWMKVRFYDDGYLDVTRTFRTNNGWGITCSDWDCLYGGTPGGGTHSCGTIPPGGACLLGQTFSPRYVYRERTEKINITQ